MTQSNHPPQRRLGRGLASLLSPAATSPAVASPAAAASALSDVSVESSAKASDMSANPAKASDVSPSSVSSSDGVSDTLPGEQSEIHSGSGAEIAIDQVRPNPHQPRRQMREAGLRELADSILSSGVIQPIVVRPVEDGYELIAGERRLRAAKLAGLTSIPAIVREVDDGAQAQMALVENIQREDLNPIERAEACQKLVARLGLTQAELAGRLGLDRSAIAHYLSLLVLPKTVQNWIAEGKLSMGHAKLLVGVESPDEQQQLAALVLADNLTVRNLERIILAGPGLRRPGPNTKTPYVQDLEKQLSSKLGFRVQVQRRTQGTGKIVIHYKSLDDFDALMERIQVEVE